MREVNPLSQVVFIKWLKIMMLGTLMGWGSLCQQGDGHRVFTAAPGDHSPSLSNPPPQQLSSALPSERIQNPAVSNFPHLLCLAPRHGFLLNDFNSLLDDFSASFLAPNCQHQLILKTEVRWILLHYKSDNVTPLCQMPHSRKS